MTAARVHSIKRRKITTTIVYHVLVAAGSIAMLYPLLWMLASSFKPNSEIFVTVGSLIPETFTAENYVNGWRGFAGMSFGVYFGNSLLVAGVSTVGAALSAACIAFGLARIRFPGRNFWFVLMIITMMLPGQVMMIPRFVLFNQMGWVGTFLPLTVPAFFGGAFDIFLVMQFIRGVPRDMDEARRLQLVWHLWPHPAAHDRARRGDRWHPDVHQFVGRFHGFTALFEFPAHLHRRLRAKALPR
mgnify:CR=1 FL=1